MLEMMMELWLLLKACDIFFVFAGLNVVEWKLLNKLGSVNVVAWN